MGCAVIERRIDAIRIRRNDFEDGSGLEQACADPKHGGIGDRGSGIRDRGSGIGVRHLEFGIWDLGFSKDQPRKNL